jgi:uncharacterized protein YegJ (DUF2314 family)
MRAAGVGNARSAARARVDLAATLLNEVASFMFEFPPPPPGELYEVGCGCDGDVAAVAGADRDNGRRDAGRRNDRQGEKNIAHTGVRAVVCDPEPRGQYTEAWVWPQSAIDAMQRDEVTLYRTRRATERQAKLARARWDQFATAYSSAHRALIDSSRATPCAIFSSRRDSSTTMRSTSDDREHLWFEVRGFHNGEAEGVLLNQPQNIARLKRGEPERIAMDQVSDWQVQTSRGVFGPDDVDSMWHALDQLKQEQRRVMCKICRSRR